MHVERKLRRGLQIWTTANPADHECLGGGKRIRYDRNGIFNMRWWAAESSAREQENFGDASTSAALLSSPSFAIGGPVAIR